MAEDNEVAFDTDGVSVIQDNDPALRSESDVVSFVHNRFKRAEDVRQQDEQRWLKAYRNYRGLYGPDVQFTETEKSRVFVKVTKTKTLAAYGQIIDVLFGNSSFPLTVNPTKLPDGVAESVHINIDPNAEKGQDELRQAFGDKPSEPFLFTPDGKLKPGETLQDLQNRLGAEKNKLNGVSEKIIEGSGTTNTTVTFHPAMVAAKKMEKKIHDQLEESGANKQLRNTAFEMALFGTGIMKGPFALDKEYPNWGEEGDYDPLIKTVPSTSHVSMWNFYPDPDAHNMDEAEYCVERHKLSKTQMRNLKNRPYFREEAIEECLDMGAQYDKKYWEDDMKDYAIENYTERYEVLEFWGYVDSEILQENGVDIPADIQDLEQINCNIWVCQGHVLRMVLNPFKPVRILYYAVIFEHNQ